LVPHTLVRPSGHETTPVGHWEKAHMGSFATLHRRMQLDPVPQVTWHGERAQVKSHVAEPVQEHAPLLAQ
jgi:hypothetical protein